MTSRQMAWIYLRRVIEASRTEVLELLWDGADSPDPEKLAHRIRTRDATLPETLLSITEQRWDCTPERDAELAKARGYRLVTPDDDEWPSTMDAAFARMGNAGAEMEANVRGQSAPPFALWVAGPNRLDTSVLRAVTVVGTRAASNYGKEVTKSIATQLAQDDVTVVSGGAMGIDTYAHTAALHAGGTTVAVMACGLDVDYPRANSHLFRHIERSGLRVSEYAPGTAPARHRFLTRNRLVASLGQVAVMVEAALRSGAINTMNWAEAMVIPNLVVPGQITHVNAQGCLVRAQQNRAELLRRYEDILVLLDPLGDQLELGLPTTEKMLSWEQTAVFDACGEGGGELADIVGNTGMAAQPVIRALRALETAGLITRVGAKWRRVE